EWLRLEGRTGERTGTVESLDGRGGSSSSDVMLAAWRREACLVLCKTIDVLKFGGSVMDSSSLLARSKASAKSRIRSKRCSHPFASAVSITCSTAGEIVGTFSRKGG